MTVVLSRKVLPVAVRQVTMNVLVFCKSFFMKVPLVDVASKDHDGVQLLRFAPVQDTVVDAPFLTVLGDVVR